MPAQTPYWADMTVRCEEQKHLGGNLFHGDSRTITPSLWKYVIDRFGVRTMLDVGAGQGHAALYFHKNDVVAYGIDGLWDNVETAIYPIVLHDLTNGPFRVAVDLVHCVVVVEHISESYIDNLMDTLCNGSIVMMTHALPGQSGHYHVNCQPPEYWIEKFANRDYRPIDDLDCFRKMATMEVPSSYFGESGLIFVKKPVTAHA